MTDIVLAPTATIETTSTTAIAPQRPYVEPKRLDVPASVVRELLQAAGLGTGCAKATSTASRSTGASSSSSGWRRSPTRTSGACAR